MSEEESAYGGGARWQDEWRDVEPTEQHEGPRPVVSIAYTEEYKEAMGYFRAALRRNELSLRSLRLSERVIALCPAHYTAWHFRRCVLEALDADLSAELEYVDGVAQENPKNYQVWQHRRWMALRIGPTAAERELDFTAGELVNGDSKNYHIWAHRQWVLRDLCPLAAGAGAGAGTAAGAGVGTGAWEKELQFCSYLLDLDVWNNSAWNQRMFVLQSLYLDDLQGGKDERGGRGGARSGEGGDRDGHSTGQGEAKDVFEKEVEFARKAIMNVPQNESPWSFLIGWLKLNRQPMHSHPTVMALCLDLAAPRPSADGNAHTSAATRSGSIPGITTEASPAANTSAQPCVHALSILVDLVHGGADAALIGRRFELPASDWTGKGVGAMLCTKLADLDKMRTRYWKLRRQDFE